MSEITSPPSAPPCHALRWRVATIVCLLIMAFATATGMSMFEQFKAQVSYLQKKLKDTAQIKYIAVLLDERHAPALLVTFDPQDTALQLQRLNGVAEGREDAMQLWALYVDGRTHSLGVLGSTSKTLRLPVSEAALNEVRELAISVENKGGAQPGKGPRLPYLVQGAVLQKAL